MNIFVSRGWLIWDILVVYQSFDCVRSHNSLFFFASEQLRIFAHLKKLVKMMRPSDSLKLVRDGLIPRPFSPSLGVRLIWIFCLIPSLLPEPENEADDCVPI